MRDKPKIKNTELSTSNIVADGLDRFLKAIESEIRSQVEQEYVNEWNSSGLIRRYFLAREINEKVKILVAAEAKKVSSTSLF